MQLPNKPKTTAFILGSLSVLALPGFYVFPILLFSLSALILLLNKESTKKRSFAIGYWFGFGFFAFGFSWVGNALLIDIARTGWLYPITLAASGLFFGFFIGFPALLTSFHKGLLPKILAFTSYVTIFEWIRSWFLTGFPWNLFGSTLAFSTTAIQTASVIGTYGLSLITIIFCCCPALIFKKHYKTGISLALIILTGVLGFGIYRTHTITDTPSDIKIRIVQPSIPQTLKWDREYLENNFQKYIDLSRSEGLEDVDIVIWGETATPFPLDMSPEHLSRITDAIPAKGILITGLVRYEFNTQGRHQPLNSMFIINKEGKILNYYDKEHLVPFGEYIPLRKYIPDSIKPVANTISDFKKGTKYKNIAISGLPTFAALICYEIIFPSEVVSKLNKPELLINLTNDGWYGDSAGPRQHLAATRLRAVEEGITIVRVANSGISAIITRIGETSDQIALNKTAILDAHIPNKLSTPTLYGKFGNLTPLILSIANIALAILLAKKISLNHW